LGLKLTGYNRDSFSTEAAPQELGAGGDRAGGRYAGTEPAGLGQVRVANKLRKWLMALDAKAAWESGRTPCRENILSNCARLDPLLVMPWRLL